MCNEIDEDDLPHGTFKYGTYGPCGAYGVVRYGTVLYSTVRYGSEFVCRVEVSASIDDDDYFELMIRNAWHIPGGQGQCPAIGVTRRLGGGR